MKTSDVVEASCLVDIKVKRAYNHSKEFHLGTYQLFLNKGGMKKQD